MEDGVERHVRGHSRDLGFSPRFYLFCIYLGGRPIYYFYEPYLVIRVGFIVKIGSFVKIEGWTKVDSTPLFINPT